MNGTNDVAMDGNGDDLSGGWFEEGELAAVPDAAPYQVRRSRVAVVIAALSAAALTLVLVFARIH